MRAHRFPSSRIALSTIFGLVGFMFASLMARLPAFQEKYQLDHADLGLVLLTISIGAIVSMPLCGRLIVYTGSRNLTRVLAFLSIVISYPLLVWTAHPFTLAVASFFVGLCNGSLDIAINAQAVLVEKKIGYPVMSSFHAIFSAGMMIGAGTGAVFTKSDVPLFLHLSMMALLASVLLVWAVRQLIPDQPTAQERLPENRARWRFRTDLVLLGLLAFCCMLGEGAMADWSTNYMLHVAAADEYLAPMGLAAFSAAMMVGRFLGDGARIRFGDFGLLQVGSILALLGMVGVLTNWSIYGNIMGFFLIGMGLATIVPIAYSRAGNAPGMPSGMSISIVTTIGYTGFFIGPPTIGFLGEAMGLRLALGFVLLLFTVMLFLSFWISKYDTTIGETQH